MIIIVSLLIVFAIIIISIISINLNKMPAETETIINISEEERILFAKVLYNESHTTSDKCIRYCGSVIINQLLSGFYGDSIEEVISRPGAFVGYKYLNNTLDANIDKELKIVDELCVSGSLLPADVYLFATFEFGNINGHEIKTYDCVDGVYFQRFTDANVH